MGDGIETAFDGDDDFGGVMGIFSEVGVEELERVGIWWAAGEQEVSMGMVIT